MNLQKNEHDPSSSCVSADWVRLYATFSNISATPRLGTSNKGFTHCIHVGIEPGFSAWRVDVWTTSLLTLFGSRECRGVTSCIHYRHRLCHDVLTRVVQNQHLLKPTTDIKNVNCSSLRLIWVLQEGFFSFIPPMFTFHFPVIIKFSISLIIGSSNIFPRGIATFFYFCNLNLLPLYCNAHIETESILLAWTNFVSAK